MKDYEIKAMGKINLGLDVIGRREDGYHLVKMVMQTVRLYDRLRFCRTRFKSIVIETNLRYLPNNENNLVYKAVDMIRKAYSINEGMHVTLDKRIPVAAGMAGGSADAAATIKAMNLMYNLGMSDERMAEFGLALGADVPYCLMGGTALAEGIGEKLTKLNDAPNAKVLLVKPNINISTKVVYEKIDSAGELTHPDIDSIIRAIDEADISSMCANMGNVLETVSCGDYPVIDEIKHRMRELGATGAMMSGSGPTVFGIFTDREAAEKAYYKFKAGEFGKNTFLTELKN